jgi:hypothetical protein
MIRALTASHSATFRAALGHPDAASGHGLALYRIAADPPERLADPYAIQHLHTDAVNCLAARLGEPQNVAFTERDEHFERARSGTHSALSVPVVVEGLVAGVVNLESTSEQNYDTRVSTAVAFAQHLGLVIADTRLALSRELEGYAMRIITEAHEIGTDCDGIVKELTDAPPSQRKRVDRHLAQIRARARGIETFVPRGQQAPSSKAWLTLSQIVDEAVEEDDLCLVDIASTNATGALHAPEAVIRIRASLQHIFANVHRHRRMSADRVDITVTSAQWGGRLYDVVRVLNATEEPIDVQRARNAYRVPVTSEETDADGNPVETPRFGAYLAGGHARELGGDVHLSPMPEPGARVVLMIPCPEPDEK